VINLDSENEYEVLKENNLLKYFREIPKFNPSRYKDFKVSLYQSSYPHWKLKCQSSIDGNAITPKNVASILDQSRSIKTWASILFGALIAMIILVTFNFLLLLIKAKEAR
jgi:hypothetical protein